MPTATPTRSGNYQRQVMPAGAGITRYFDGYGLNSGLGVVARRFRPDVDRLIARSNTMGGLCWFAQESPLLLLRALSSVHPMARMAMGNNLALAFGTDQTRFYAVKDYKSGKGTKDDAETENINRLWTNGYASLPALQKALAKPLHTDGMFVVEAVPGASGEGIDGIYDCDALAFRYNDFDPMRGRHGRRLEQRRDINYAGNGVTSGYAGLMGTQSGQWDTVDTTTVFTGAVDYSYEMPYGEPIFGAFATEGVADLAHQRNISDGLHAVFFSRLAVEVPWSKWYQIAKDEEERGDPGKLLTDGNGASITSIQWADAQFAGWQASLANIKADDIMLLAEGAKAYPLNVSLQGIDAILDKRLLRVCQSLQHFPALLGVTFGGREAWAKEQVKVYVNWLYDLRTIVNSALLNIANLDLRLRGVDMICKCETSPITLEDLVAIADARAKSLENTGTEIVMGLSSGEDAAMSLTGSGIADPEQFEAWKAAATSAVGSAPKPVEDPAPKPTGDDKDAVRTNDPLDESDDEQ